MDGTIAFPDRRLVGFPFFSLHAVHWKGVLVYSLTYTFLVSPSKGQAPHFFDPGSPMSQAAHLGPTFIIQPSLQSPTSHFRS